MRASYSYDILVMSPGSPLRPYHMAAIMGTQRLFPMMTSSNENVFRVTGTLCGEFTGEFPSQRPVTRSFDVFFDLRLNKRLSKQSIRRDLRRHRTLYSATAKQQICHDSNFRFSVGLPTWHIMYWWINYIHADFLKWYLVAEKLHRP